MDSLITNHLGAVVAALSALAVIAGGLVGIVLKVLQGYRWLMQEFEEVKGAIFAMQHGVEARFTEHEKEERAWQSDVTTKVDDMRERMARMEGKLEAAEQERMRRVARESPTERADY
jgi:hypothetical protein